MKGDGAFPGKSLKPEYAGDQASLSLTGLRSGARLHQMALVEVRVSDNAGNQFDEGQLYGPLRMDDLATQVSMSTSTFHNHFRTVTAMSLLEYQRWLRLNEARRLMLAEDQDETMAAFQVGYVSPSQFSRECSRLFGSPLLRDGTNLRQRAIGENGIRQAVAGEVG